MKHLRLFTVAALMAFTMLLSGCGGGSGSSSSTGLDADTENNIDSAYTLLESAERDSLTTILTNSDDEDVQGVMTAMSDARSGGLTSADIQAARTDSLARIKGRANPYDEGTSQYLLYEALADSFAELRKNNPTVFGAYTTLVETIDDDELDAVTAVIESAQEMGFSSFATVIQVNITVIVASVPPASDEDDTDDTADDTDDTADDTDDTADDTDDTADDTDDTADDTDDTADDTDDTADDTDDTADDTDDSDTADVITTEVAEGLGGDGTETVSKGAVNTTPLNIASRVSVVDSKEEASTVSDLPSFARTMMRAISDTDIAAWGEDVDYNKDKTQVWVNDRSSESFGIINEILCSIKQTRYDDMINAGPYIAQIDIKLCEQNSAEGKEAEQAGVGSDTATIPEYEYWVVESIREDDSSVQVIHAWIQNEEEYGDGITRESVIMARMVIYGDVEDYPPYGLFTMNFKQVPYVNGTKQIDPFAETTFEGTMKSFINTEGENLISFSLESDMEVPQEILDMFGLDSFDENIQMSEYVIMATSQNGSAGRGATYMSETFPNMWDPNATELEMETESATYNIAFNDTYFLRENVDTDTQACYERNSPKRNVYRYGLYDENGARVNLRSGLSVGFEDDEGELRTGWAGFWGVHVDGYDGSIAELDGQVINRFDWADHTLDTSEAYTINVYPGKLKKITRNVTTLTRVKNTRFSYWDDSTGEEYRIEWDGTGFLKSAIRDQSNWTWDETGYVTAAQYLDVSAMQWPEIYVWSEALNGSVKIDLNGTSTDPEAEPQCTEPNWNDTFTYNCTEALDPSVPVVIYKESTVMPGSAAADAAEALGSFICYDSCPDPDPADVNDPFFENVDWVYDADTDRYVEVRPDVTYTFDATEMALQYNGQNVVVPDGSNYDNIWTGALIQADDVSELACDWEEDGICEWMAESRLSTFYRWESGTDTWNKLIALVNNDTNLVENFAQPLSVEYEHTFDNGDTKTFVLNYEGFGNLHGIPESCEDGDTGEPIDCPWWTGEDYDGWVRVISDFAIPAGAPASYLDPDSGTDVDVVVKPLEEEHIMRANETTAACTNAGLLIADYSSQFVSIDGWVDPSDYGMEEIPYDEMKAEGGNGIQPAVIAGEIQ